MQPGHDIRRLHYGRHVVDIEALGLRKGIVGRLRSHGIATVEDLVTLCPREVHDLRGIGDGALAAIEAAVADAGYEFAEDAFAPYICAREGVAKRDVGLASFIICERCADAWTSEPFAGTEPDFVGDRWDGYCLNCNELCDDLRFRQWFLCGVCERVARSIGRSVVAARSVVTAWEQQIEPTLPDLTLIDADPPRLMRKTAGSQEERRAVATADLIIQRADGSPLLGIEMKVGRSYVEGSSIGTKIARFQLDVSDCDEIIAVTERDRVPTYLLHAQVVDRAEPPTLRYVGINQWWTDPLSMADHFINVAIRGRETKLAAYYKTAMFRPLRDLAEHISGGGVQHAAERLAELGWRPELYRLSETDAARLAAQVDEIENEGS